jgi:hypothetical protein
VDRRHRAAQAQPLLQLRQRQVWFFGHQRLQRASVLRQQLRLASAKPIPRSQVSSPALLLQQLLDHPQRYFEPLRHFFSRPGPLGVGRHDSFPQVHRDWFSHPANLLDPLGYGYNFI